MKCKFIETYSVGGTVLLKPKRKFETLDQAIEQAKHINSFDTTIHKYVAYKCNECHKYHIGKSQHLLKEKDRIKYKEYGKKIS